MIEILVTSFLYLVGFSLIGYSVFVCIQSGERYQRFHKLREYKTNKHARGMYLQSYRYRKKQREEFKSNSNYEKARKECI